MKYPSSRVVPGLKEDQKVPDSLLIQQVVFFVCKQMHADIKEVLSSSRKNDLITARFTIMSLLRDREITLKTIGEYFGRDHTTVIHACRKVRDWLDTEEDYKNTYEQLKVKIRLSE